MFEKYYKMSFVWKDTNVWDCPTFLERLPKKKFKCCTFPSQILSTIDMYMYLPPELQHTSSSYWGHDPPVWRHVHPLLLLDFDGFSTVHVYMYSPENQACSHVYQIHQTPPAAFVGFRTVYSQVTDFFAFCYCINSIKVQQLGDVFGACRLILVDSEGFVIQISGG